MGNITVDSDELKNLIKETLIDVLTTRKDLIEDAVIEAIEDISLGRAIEEGRTGEYMDEKEFLKKLNKTIKALK